MPDPIPSAPETAIAFGVVAVICIWVAVKQGHARALMVWLGFKSEEKRWN